MASKNSFVDRSNLPVPPNRARRLSKALLVVAALAHFSGLGRASSNEILIYYANETAPEGQEARNYDAIIGWLEQGNDARLAQIAGQLQRDRHTFQAAVDLEVHDLSFGLSQLKDGPQALLFTNRLARRGKCLIVCDDRTAREIEFPIPSSDNYIVAANPLASSETLAAALTLAAREFSPENDRYVLIVKSHGSATKALTPRLAVRAEDTDRDELLKYAVGRPVHDGIHDWTEKVGTSKTQFLQTLADAGSRFGIRFSLVFLEACKANTPETHTERIPENVDRFMLIRGHAHYVNILYADVLDDWKPTGSLADDLTQDLPTKFLVEAAGPAKSSTPPWRLQIAIIGVPALLLGVGWAVWRVRRRHDSHCVETAITDDGDRSADRTRN